MRLLAPFDPIVWDRRRFELLWGWPYRFEAYTPVAKRKLGYYALPLLWRDRVWAGAIYRWLMAADGHFGYADAGLPATRVFQAGLDAEIESINCFLRL